MAATGLLLIGCSSADPDTGPDCERDRAAMLGSANLDQARRTTLLDEYQNSGCRMDVELRQWEWIESRQ